MLNKIKSQTRATEVDTTTLRIISAFLNSNLNNDSHLTSIFSTLQPLSQQFNKAINRIKAESDLDTKDEVRDNAARSFYYLINGYSHHPDETIRKAALNIMDIFNQYGLKVVKENYATETSLLNSLLNELTTAEAQVDVALISGANESITTLQNAQKAFESSHLSYEQNKANEGTFNNASALKKEVLNLVNSKLVVYLRAMYTVDPETYGPFTRTVGQIIADNNEVVKKRAKKTVSEIEL